MRFIARWASLSVAILVAVYLVPGIEPVGDRVIGPLLVAVTLALLNATLKPLLQLLTLPLTILSLGLFSLALNAMMLELASGWATQITGYGIAIATFGSAFFAAIIISLVASIVGSVVGAD